MKSSNTSRRAKAPVSRYVIAPLGYTGGKSRLLHKILPELGDLGNHDFIDLFAGGMSVGMNSGARSVWFNDVSEHTVRLLQYLSESRPGQIEAEIASLRERYQLSDSATHGYDFYGTDSSKGLATTNRPGFLRLRDDVNAGRFQGRELSAAEFAVVVFGFNNYIYISCIDGRWITPAGKRDFNTSMKAKTARTVDHLSNLPHHITELDFRDLDVTEAQRPFVYADPPYSLGKAPYNRDWSRQDDLDLIRYLDQLDELGIPFAMSNVLSLKGERNELIADWARKYRVVHLDFDYDNASHRRSADPRTEEVLILNTV